MWINMLKTNMMMRVRINTPKPWARIFITMDTSNDEPVRFIDEGAV